MKRTTEQNTNKQEVPIRYKNIRKAIEEHEAETLAQFAQSLENKTASELLNSWQFRDRMTPATFQAMKNTDPDAIPSAELLEKIYKKRTREEAKNTAARLEKLAAAERAAAPEYITVSVEWVRSRTWGANPNATVEGAQSRTYGKASGCGYDKESAAIAYAMNENPEIMRILYDHAEQGEPFPYSVHTFAGVPSFNGGCGVSCFREVFESCGYDWHDNGRGSMFAAYSITRKQ